MKKLIFVIGLLMIVISAQGQTKDSTVSIDKGKAKDVSGKREYITNRQQIIFGVDTMANATVSAQLVYDINSVKMVAKEWYGIVDSLSTTVDTAGRKIAALRNYISTSRYLIVATCDSAWQYSSTSGFTAGRTFMLKAGESEAFMVLEPSNLNLYFKKWSSFAGKALFRIKIYLL
jgi:hypothetical protein